MIWRVNQKSVVVLGGMTALLLQFAHPLVAAGVRDHSDFRSDPTGRLLRTYRLTLNLVFGTREQALESAREINRRHRAVQGPDYSATDPELLLWVQATLVYSALRAYAEFVRPLSDSDRDGYYQDTKRLGTLLGVPPASYPVDIRSFDEYFAKMINGPVRVTGDARTLANALLRLRIGAVPRVAVRPLVILTAGLLPPAVRDAYGLAWGRTYQSAFRLARGIVRTLDTLAPPLLRELPPARLARRRVEAHRDLQEVAGA
jgi:uncharacterized protein (DUF2236 family)